MQQTITRKLYGSSTATTNDLAHIDLPFGMFLVGLGIDIVPTGPSNTDALIAEVSVSSNGQQNVNDAQGVLGNASYAAALITSGIANIAVNTWNAAIAVFLPAGTRVYLHTYQVGTNATKVLVNLHFLPA